MLLHVYILLILIHILDTWLSLSKQDVKREPTLAYTWDRQESFHNGKAISISIKIEFKITEFLVITINSITS